MDAARGVHTIDAFLGRLVGPAAAGTGAPVEIVRPGLFAAPKKVSRTRPTEHRLLGFWFVRGDEGRITYPPTTGGYDSLTCPFWIVAVPYWFVMLLAAILPAAWLGLRWRATRRRRSNACARCGYDLRATPGCCPECGTVPATATTAV